jgi:hypothetical protein
MARPKGQTESRSTWFRGFFRRTKANLKMNNADVRAAWQAEHPNETWTKKHDNTMANVKSYEKKRAGVRGKRRKKKAAEDGEPAAKAARAAISGSALERLEFDIDQCLIAARALVAKDQELENVARLLHTARNKVILIGGKG